MGFNTKPGFSPAAPLDGKNKNLKRWHTVRAELPYDMTHTRQFKILGSVTFLFDKKVIYSMNLI